MFPAFSMMELIHRSDYIRSVLPAMLSCKLVVTVIVWNIFTRNTRETWISFHNCDIIQILFTPFASLPCLFPTSDGLFPIAHSDMKLFTMTLDWLAYTPLSLHLSVLNLIGYFADITKFPASTLNKHKLVTDSLGIYLDKYSTS